MYNCRLSLRIGCSLCDDTSTVASFAPFRFRLVSLANFFAINDPSMASNIPMASPIDFSKEVRYTGTVLVFIFRSRSVMGAENNTQVLLYYLYRSDLL